MNADDTQAPAGRETDAKVARAMGWKWYTFGPKLARAKEVCWLDNPADRLRWGSVIVEAVGDERIAHDAYSRVPTYSADTDEGYAAMREVLAWLNKLGIEVSLDQFADFQWIAQCTGTYGEFRAPSLPLAVCRLALAVANAERENTK
jgi:hypothetical protein